MKKYKISFKEFSFAAILAFMGFIFTTRRFLLFLDSLNPFQGLIFYYIILFICLFLLSKAGLIVSRFKIKSLTQVFGMLLITFAFFIIVDWESPYINYATKGNLPNVSNIYFQAEDGAVWYLWSLVVSDVNTLRFLTYIFTPFILALIGAIFVTKIKLQSI
ncbi:MAG: hypothetical protein QXF83_06925 [Candidatus Bathyarchaeia archaeon]